MTIKVEGDLSEVQKAFSRQDGDIKLSFRWNLLPDYLQKKAPGLRIEVLYDRFKNREFSTIDEGLTYLRQLYRERMRK